MDPHTQQWTTVMDEDGHKSLKTKGILGFSGFTEMKYDAKNYDAVEIHDLWAHDVL